MKNLLFLPLLTLVFSCAPDAENDAANTIEPNNAAIDTSATPPPPPAIDEALEALSEADRQTYMEQYGIDVYRGVPKPLIPGQTAPIFKANDNHGKEWFMAEEYQKQPLVIVFYRGQWCPACNRHLSALNDSLKYIQKAGGRLIAITPETSENIKLSVDKSKAKFPIISDPNGYIAQAFGVDFFVTETYQKMINDKLQADIATNNGTEEANLPVPATYIIGTDGKVKYAHFHPDYHLRATAAEIVTELKKLK